MFPVPGYMTMNSHPYQSNQMPSTQYYHPNPQPKEDPTGPSFIYEPWPHNYGYPIPMQPHNCCNHAQYPPYYSFRPPCPQFPSHNNFCGGYPAYPQHYPVSYVPPPHYTTELPRYEYEKSVPTEFHSCRCPNHPCHAKEGKNVRIQEHEPDAETTSQSLIPTNAGASNFHYPVLWIPPGYTMNKGQPQRLVDNEADQQQVSPYLKKPQWQRRPTEAVTEEQQHTPCAEKPQQNAQTVQQHPNVRYEWFPLDMDSIRQLIEGGHGRKEGGRGKENGDGKKNQDVENKDQNEQFRYPIFWIPYQGQGDDRVRSQEEGNAGRASAEEAPATLKIFPLKSEKADNEVEKKRIRKGDHDSGVGTQMTQRARNLKIIPVKQLEEPIPKSSMKDEEHKEDEAPERIIKGNTNQDPVKNGTNGQSSSPTKKSKLPPICLRVDPPKKKNGNVTSRSPSPPGDKRRQESDDTKAGGKSKEVHPSNKEMKDTEGVENTPSGKKVPVSQPAGEEEKASRTVEVKLRNAERKVVHEIDDVKLGNAKSGLEEGMRAQDPHGVNKSKPQNVQRPVRKILSETEAAAKIQSAYRGYEVRRWEPLKKLRQIAKVHEEALRMKKHIEELESCGGPLINHTEKSAVGETIMKLLLKLDTIQGLHPSIRDVRRSAAKDLIILQEKLDSIATKTSVAVSQDTVAIETLQETSKVSMIDGDSKKTDQAAEEYSKVSKQNDGSQGGVISLKAVQEDESLSNVKKVQTAEEPSKVPDQDEGSQGGDMKLKAAEEDEASYNMIKVSSSNPPTNQDVMCEPGDTETSQILPLYTDSNSKSQEGASSSACSSAQIKTIASCTDTKDREHDESDSFLGKLSAESQKSISEQELADDAVVQDTMMSREDDETNILAELSQEVIEDTKKETLETEYGMGTTVSLREQSLENALLPNEAVKVDSTLTDKDVELNALDELPQAVTNEPTSDVSSVENTKIDQEVEKADPKCEEFVNNEPECHKPDRNEMSSKADSGHESESAICSVNVEIPMVQQDVHGVQGQSDEETPTETGLLASEVSEVAGNEKEEIKESSQASDFELNSTVTSLESTVSNNEDVSELLIKDEESECPHDQEIVHGHCNMNEQSEGSEAVVREDFDVKYVPQLGAPQDNDEHRPSKPLAVEGFDNEDQLDKKIIEENEKLRAMVEKLLASGKKQQDLISSLSGKVQDLEQKLAKRKKSTKSTKRPRMVVSRPVCGKSSNASLRKRPVGIAS